MIPEGIVSSVWPRVERRLATAGVEFDEWQRGFSSAALGCRADGKYAASIGGVVESVPRQVGKTFKIGHLMVGLAVEFPRLRVVWTSHHNRTTTDTFRTMQGLVNQPKLRGYLAARNPIRTANGEQEIRFANGSIIMFGAREQGFGRGIPQIDIIVFDEAQILGLKALADMVPTANRGKHVHGSLVFLLGTPPRPTDNGEAFTSFRRSALAGDSPHRMLVELSADPDARWDDRAQWRKANPSYPVHTPEEAMLRMHELIPDDDNWRREAMGIWDPDDVVGWTVVSADNWTARQDPGAPAKGWLADPVALSVEVSKNGETATICAAGAVNDGVGVTVLDRGPTSMVVAKITAVALDDTGTQTLRLVADFGGPAGALKDDLETAGLKVTEIKFADLKAATGWFLNHAREGGLFHRGEDELTVAMSVAELRKAGEAQVIDRWADRDASSAIGAVVACHGHSLGPVRAKPRVFNMNDYLEGDD